MNRVTIVMGGFNRPLLENKSSQYRERKEGYRIINNIINDFDLMNIVT